MDRIIAIANQKGGVGKSTTAINLSACLAEAGKKVLTIDMDPQGNTTSGIGIAKRGLKKTMYEILVDDQLEPEDAILETIVPGLDIIPASVELAGAEIELVHLQGREKRLKNALDKNKLNQINDYDNRYDGDMVLDKLFQYKIYLPQLIKSDMRNYAFHICREDCTDFINEFFDGSQE